MIDPLHNASFLSRAVRLCIFLCASFYSRRDLIIHCVMLPMSRSAWIFLEVFSCEGGIQSYVRDLLQSIAQAAIPGDVFLLRDAPGVNNFLEGSSLQFHYYKQQSAQLGRLRLAAGLLKYLLFNRPDRVYCGHLFLVPLVQALCKPLGIPYTVIVHGKEVWNPIAPALQSGLRNAAEIWTVSRYTRDRMSQTHQLDATKIRLLPCCVDGQQFQPAARSPELVAKYGLADAKVLMTVARLWSGDPYKGVDVTIRALPTIAQKFPTVKYLVVGRGDDQPRLAQLAADLGVGDRVVFAGFVADADLVDHYNLSDAYIMPSQEGFGIVYLEAMACGKPVLSGDADGSADPLQDGKLGWQVPHRDVDRVAIACQEILAGTDPRCDANWLRAQALGLFDRSAFAQRALSLMATPAHPLTTPSIAATNS
jgi:glycosyltransferase involved in cell wall biosynthesis